MGVLVLTELDDRDLCETSLDALATARDLSKRLHTWSAAVVLGGERPDIAPVLARIGAQDAYHARDPRLDARTPALCAAATIDLAARSGATVVMSASTTWANEVLAEVAARTDAPVLTNRASMRVDGTLLRAAGSHEADGASADCFDVSSPHQLVLVSLDYPTHVDGIRPPRIQSFAPVIDDADVLPVLTIPEVFGAPGSPPESLEPAAPHEGVPQLEPPPLPGAMASTRGLTLLAAVAVFMIALELTVIAVALPEIAARFLEASPSMLGWIFTSYNIGVASLLLLAGWMAERFGRKRIFLIGLVVFGFGSILSGAAPSIDALIGGRVVQSIGGAMLLPSSLALILHGVPRSEHKRSIAIWGATAGLAAAIGPTLGALLVEYTGWRTVFLMNVPIAFLAALIGRWKLIEGRIADRRRIDLFAVPVASLATGFGVYGITRLGEAGIRDRRALALVAAAAVLTAVFAHRTVRHETPLFPPRLARQRAYAVGQASLMLFAMTFSAWLALAPTFLVVIWGYSTLQAGLALAPAPVLMAVLAQPAGRLAERFGFRPIVAIGLIASAGAMAYWAVVVTGSAYYVSAFLPGLILFGFGLGLAFPMLTAATVSQVVPAEYEIASAGAVTCRQIAIAVGIATAIAIVGERLGSVDAYRQSWIVAGALGLAAAAVFVAGFPRVRDAVNEAGLAA